MPNTGKGERRGTRAEHREEKVRARCVLLERLLITNDSGSHRISTGTSAGVV